MANPHEYRTMMYEVFHEGKTPTAKGDTSKSKPGSSAVAELEAELALMQQLQAQQGSED